LLSVFFSFLHLVISPLYNKKKGVPWVECFGEIGVILQKLFYFTEKKRGDRPINEMKSRDFTKTKGSSKEQGHEIRSFAPPSTDAVELGAGL
jgi:hypothetical protein